jgi:hypothetical protein
MSPAKRDELNLEAIAAALRAERENTETANAAAVNAYAKVRELEALLDTAKSALAGERAKLEKFAAFAGPDGEPRKVLGTLPVTADGAIAIPFVSVVYHPEHPQRSLDVDVCQDEVIGQVSVPGNACTEWHEYPIGDCYSTRAAAKQAAEAAAGGKK